MTSLRNLKSDYSAPESPFENRDSFVLELMCRLHSPVFLEKARTCRCLSDVFFALGDLFVQILSPKWAGLTLTAKRHSGHQNTCAVVP